MNENEIGKIIVDTAIKVHRNLGPGLFESVYRVALEYELKQQGFKVEHEVPVPIVYHRFVLIDKCFAPSRLGGKTLKR